ncbi:hypothetical protein [Massilia sp. TWR1-2-2]
MLAATFESPLYGTVRVREPEIRPPVLNNTPPPFITVIASGMSRMS